MKSKKLKSLFSVLALASGIILFNPTSASAAWKHDGHGWWNTEGSSYSTGWRDINNQWYYFGSDGYMKTGWLNSGGSWYYLDNSGAMNTGWMQSPYSGKWYYMNPSNGDMQTGWVQSPYSGKWYYMNPSNGDMQTGWINDNGTWYYTNESGTMQTGLLTINNNTYYFNQSGAMVTGDITINGVKYTFASSGEKVSSSSVSNTTNQNTSNTEHSTGSSTSGGGGGSSSSSNNNNNNNNNATHFLGYSDLYGTWNVNSYIKDSGMKTNLSDSEIKFIVGLDFTVSKDKIYYDALINASNPTIKESVLTKSEFEKKFGTSISKLGISGDKVKCITISAKDGSNDVKTGYVIVSGNNDVYVVVKGAVFRLKRA